MADGKSFVLYKDWWALFEDLSLEQRGQLITAIFDFQLDREISPMDQAVKVGFNLIKNKMDEDRDKYVQKCEQNAQNRRIAIDRLRSQTNDNDRQRPSTTVNNRQRPDSDNDNDNGNDNDNDKDIKKHCPVDPDGEDVKAIVYHLNEKTGSQYKPSTPQTRTLIKARLREGFTRGDFFEVIDKKSKEWKGTEQGKYLRPQTLFGTKFEAYLNQEEPREQKRNTFADMEEHDHDMDSLERELLLQTIRGA